MSGILFNEGKNSSHPGGKKLISRERDLTRAMSCPIFPPFRPLRGRFMRRYEGGTGCGNPRACVTYAKAHDPGRHLVGSRRFLGPIWRRNTAPSGPAAVEGDKPSIAAWRAKVTLMHPRKDVSDLLREVAR